MRVNVLGIGVVESWLAVVYLMLYSVRHVYVYIYLVPLIFVTYPTPMGQVGDETLSRMGIERRFPSII